MLTPDQKRAVAAGYWQAMAELRQDAIKQYLNNPESLAAQIAFESLSGHDMEAGLERAIERAEKRERSLIMRNADMPAMPSGIDEDYHNIAQKPLNLGLTKREYFAAMAMQGIIASLDKAVSEEDLAEEAVTAADALLAELEKES